MDFSDKPIPAARKHLEAEAVLFAEPQGTFAIEEDLVIPSPACDLPATRYRTFDLPPRGVMVYFHGGGFSLGSRASTDSAVRFLARETNCDVLSVDYRLAPEHPFPACIEDALTAYDFAVESAEEWGASKDSLVTAGDSAGGNISVVLGQLLRDHPHRPALHLAFCPSTNFSAETPLYDELADGYFLTRKQMDWYRDTYVPDKKDLLDTRCSPLLAQDVSGLAPHYIGVAGFDLLRDEGLAYAERLREAGTPVTVHRASNVIHPYINLTAFSPACRAASQHAADAVVAALQVTRR